MTDIFDTTTTAAETDESDTEDAVSEFASVTTDEQEEWRGPVSDRRAQVLLVANTYPSDQALYRNAFIHRRVLAYLEAGIDVEVYYLHPPVEESYGYLFDGVQVTVGGPADYEQRIAAHRYRTILVHFANEHMIRPVVEHQPETPVIVWVHGFEAEAWHRRWFNFTDSATQIRQALAKRDDYHVDQLRLMGRLMSATDLDVRIVHVSDWFRRNIVEPDTGVSTRHPYVIPNIVDGDFFPYREKEPEHRLRVLSIRPFASHKYANDQTVAAILELSTRPFFDRLSFTIRGEGPMFAETVSPLRDLPSVSVQEGFLRQEEIAELHVEHGVFLAPTRFDSQGVSMCEAMASGLVPVSTAIAAIPEFVEDRVTGLLTAPEDPAGLADRIEMLYYNPELFQRLSESAARRVREQCGHEATVSREIEMIGRDL
ncbi:glycosyltransferase family 4 protein [Phycicoccus sp. CSK15P-2]|uniref:glycosyltransferase family 4 protein n=1 Tax=Phycicoccus sp. CSK15P-2 TaxID=2807627 RepID=UPI00195236A2|nr:glycosyltransferase family 4 protein [Phycicoccus sp. CSK15P-2]MBM6403501.1 glycosyltransferase family 4 protein [Phycicoccus sp. CSK15P-2]